MYSPGGISNHGSVTQRPSTAAANIVVIPGNELVFRPVEDGQGRAEAHVVILNPTDSSVSYKFKTDAENQGFNMFVRPPTGVVPPGRNQGITATLRDSGGNDLANLKVVLESRPSDVTDPNFQSVSKILLPCSLEASSPPPSLPLPMPEPSARSLPPSRHSPSRPSPPAEEPFKPYQRQKPMSSWLGDAPEPTLSPPQHSTFRSRQPVQQRFVRNERFQQQPDPPPRNQRKQRRRRAHDPQLTAIPLKACAIPDKKEPMYFFDTLPLTRGGNSSFGAGNVGNVGLVPYIISCIIWIGVGAFVGRTLLCQCGGMEQGDGGASMQ